jgi:broad specificity phosphatase PhoE
MMRITGLIGRLTTRAIIGAAAFAAVACAGFYTFLSADASGRPLVILVRHGDAPGSGEPEGFTLGKCSTQRNLSDKGRKQAGEIGNRLRAAGIDVTKVMASELCRTQQTAALMRLGPVESAAAFDDLADFKQRGDELLGRERRIIADWRGPGALLIVTHGSNIKALTGFHVQPGAVLMAKFSDEQLVATLFSTSE